METTAFLLDAEAMQCLEELKSLSTHYSNKQQIIKTDDDATSNISRGILMSISSKTAVSSQSKK